MENLKIALFGQFQISYNNIALPHLKNRKAQELFAYLLLYREQRHHREFLANLIWEDTNQIQAKNYLRKTIWQLQSILNELDETLSDELLQVDDEWITINPKANLNLDVAQFEEAFTRTQDLSGKKIDSGQLLAVESAIKLYRGNLLEGWYQDWCLFERERFQQMYLGMLDKLMDCCEAHGEWERGLMYGSLILRYDNARERTHRRLMRLFYLSRDRTAALRQFERCKEALQSELGVAPSRLTMKLYRQICKDPITVPRSTILDALMSEETDQSLPGMLIQLDELNRTLARVQNQVDFQIKKIEAILNEPH